MVDFEHCKAARVNVECDTDTDTDRLSMLPDDLIHKILSYLTIRNAVTTCALSSRWRFIWTSMPYLAFSIHVHNYYFDCVNEEFVNHVLSRRNNQTEVSSVELVFNITFSEVLFKRVIDYAFSHNVQKLSVSCLLDDKVDFPLDIFRSRSLKYLKLGGCFAINHCGYSVVLVSIWELSALTTLHLDEVEFYDDVDDDGSGTGLFSKCVNLKSLTLSDFTILKSSTFTISHPRLLNLTLKDGDEWAKGVNVVAPQLESLTIRSCYGKHLISAPSLVSLLVSGSCRLKFSTDLCSLEKADICIDTDVKWGAFRITSLLQQLHNVKFLTLNLEFIVPLSRFMEHISLQPPPFCNLKSLKIHPVRILSDDEAHKYVRLATKVISYLREGSPTATFRMISYEELKEKEQQAQAFANASEAQHRMDEFQTMIKDEKTVIEEMSKTYMDGMNKAMESHEAETHDQGNAPMEKMNQYFERKMEQIKSCWEDTGVQIDRWRSKIEFIISQLSDIEALLLKDLPSIKRDKLQACFSSLRAEADTVVKNILHHMKAPQIHLFNLNDCFNELATTSLSS